MKFQNPYYFLLLLVLLAVIYIERKYIKKSAFPLANFKALKSTRKGFFAYISKLVPFLKYAGFFFLIVSVARPQTESSRILTGKGVDIMIALDMSGSMNAVDKSFDEILKIQKSGRNPKNRFEIARDVIKKFVLSRPGDRIGLVIFGKEAYLKFPLTLDKKWIIESLDSLVLDNGFRKEGVSGCLNNCTISGSSTAIGDALARAYMRIKNSKSKSKNIILITDGKNNSGSLDPITVAKYIANQPEDKRAKVYTILVGSGKNTKIPLIDPVTGQYVRNSLGYIQYDTPNAPIPTDPELLKKIAKITGGKFFESYNEENFRKIFDKLQKTEFKKKTTVVMNDVFDYFLFIAFILLGLERLFVWGVIRRFP